MRTSGATAAASISRSMRFARSSRLTERTKPSDDAVRKASGAGGGASTSASRPVESRSRPATIDDVVKIFFASPSVTWSKSSTFRRRARSSADSENCPSSVRSRSQACRNWCSSHTTLFGCRTAYDGNFVEIQEAPEERLREHALAGIPLERHRHELRLVPVLAERLDEAVREDLGAA